MADRLKMAKVNAGSQLRERGWSFRRSARKLGGHRDAVSGAAREAEAGRNPAKVAHGNAASRRQCQTWASHTA